MPLAYGAFVGLLHTADVSSTAGYASLTYCAKEPKKTFPHIAHQKTTCYISLTYEGTMKFKEVPVHILLF